MCLKESGTRRNKVPTNSEARWWREVRSEERPREWSKDAYDQGFGIFDAPQLHHTIHTVHFYRIDAVVKLMCE